MSRDPIRRRCQVKRPKCQAGRLAGGPLLDAFRRCATAGGVRCSSHALQRASVSILLYTVARGKANGERTTTCRQALKRPSGHSPGGTASAPRRTTPCSGSWMPQGRPSRGSNATLGSTPSTTARIQASTSSTSKVQRTQGSGRRPNNPLEVSMVQYRPRQLVPKSGIYRVVHDQAHIEAHDVTAVIGERFPPSHHCDQHPRFMLERTAHHLDKHPALSSDQVRTGRLGREHAFGSAMSFGHRMQGVYHGEVADIVNTAECCTQVTTSGP